ncbi:MAG: ATP-binding protein [Candidatus Methylumidiphilus sp.]
MSTPPKLLLIDDFAENIAVLGEYLSDDYDIEFALSGADGLARIAQNPPDLILLDVMMPVMDGYAVCATLKSDPATRDIPIIFVTAKNDGESESRALAAGAVDFIHKPVNRDVVAARVRMQLDLQSNKRALETLNAELKALNGVLEQQVQERTQALREALLRAEASHHAKNLFIANINHELRTPMNAILGLSELLVRQVGDPKLQERVGKIRGACQRLLDLVNQVIDIADLQAGRVPIESIDFELSSLLDGVLEKHQKSALAKGLPLELAIDPALPVGLRGDPARLTQILENFLRNALAFSAHGSIVLRASRVAGPGPAAVRFAVEDQGMGIDDKHLALIFNVFEQVDMSSTRQIGGAGIGLAICKQLAELMGGKIGVSSALGQGSIFWVTFPLDAAPMR